MASNEVAMNGYEALRNRAAVIDLSARGKIRVTGEDRARLLHAMSTNHVQDLAPNHALYAFFLNDKGRILSDAYIYNLGDSLFLDTEPEAKAKLFEHLDRYIIADDATLEDEADSLAAIGIEGPKSLDIATQLELPVAGANLGIEQFGGGFTVRVTATGAQGFRLFIPVADKEDFIARLQAVGAVSASAEEARIVRLENGVPRYGEEITERYLAQETQLDRALHFYKGCYLGQEIVERVRSRGQVHRLLTPVRIVIPTPPPPGTKLTANGVDVAEIASAVYSPALNEVVGLAYVRTEAVHAKPEMTVKDSEPAILAYVVER